MIDDGPSPFATNWPKLPTGPKLSARDVGLIDLARYAARQAAMPLGTIRADTDELWDLLKVKADDLGPDLDRDAVLDALEPVALTWARNRAQQRFAELSGA